MQAPLLPALPGYDNLELIAHGTTALVYRAMQTRLNRLVAIKVITADTGSSHVDPARELATTVSLSSQPHIVSIIDTGVTEDDRPFIVMEYCEGGSYAQILRNTGPLPVEDVIEVGVKIGEALHAAHQVGIVHRDVKPSNILRSRFGPALTDFGIARAPDELGGTLTRELMTPHHASPEALLHQAQSGLSDVYSLASTMWTLLAGHPPYVDPSQPPLDVYAFRDRVLHDPLAPMTRKDVPAWLVAELTRALAKLPAQRHASALEFTESLRRATLGLRPARPAVPEIPAQSPAWRASTPVPTGASPSGAAPMGRPPADAPLPAPMPAAVAVPARPVSSPPSAPPPSAPPPSAPPPSAPPPSAPPAPAPPAWAPPVSAASGSVPAAAHPMPVAVGPFVAPAPISAEIIEEDGWLGPATARGDGGIAQRSTPTQRFHEQDLVGVQPRHRGSLVAALVAVAVLAVAAAAILSLTARGGPPDAASPGTASPGADTSARPTGTQFLTAAPGAPRAVTLDDRGTTVIVRWTDPANGQVPFVVTGRTKAGQAIGLRQVERTVTSAIYSELDPETDYCFLVTAVYSGTRLAPSPWTCTAR